MDIIFVSVVKELLEALTGDAVAADDSLSDVLD